MSQALSYFRHITTIPRLSKKEEKIRAFLVDWACDKGYAYVIDTVGNLVISVPKAGTASDEPVILQAHMDMVYVQTPDSTIDFETDPLDIYEEDGYLQARGTSLGADNGIGVALAMSASAYLNHPPLELVFTIDEEAGMSGVLGLDFSLLHGKRVINLDNENDQEICISSAGGIGINLEKQLDFEETGAPLSALSIYGMKGGHSGVEIGENHGNAVEVLLGFFQKTSTVLGVVDIQAGTASNVIPSRVDTIIVISDEIQFRQELSEYLSYIRTQFDCPDITFDIEKVQENRRVITDAQALFRHIHAIPVGVMKMSEKITGLVQTSISLGQISIKGGRLKITYLARSSKNNELSELVESVEEHFRTLGFSVERDRGYPGWQEDPNGALIKIIGEEITRVTGNPPNIIALHAGLECGALVSGLGTGATAVSVGPVMYDIHSVNERLEIASVERMEHILEGVLRRL
ncbi:MAG: beta-Ala-His dipeptidase [Candidatus Gracilibacteria bacterium]|nr:beta-Ala-His dipeptidase [Candidatus Gracilibacteria bacterium]